MEVISSNKNEIVIRTLKLKEKFEGILFLDNPKTIEEAYFSNLTFDYILVDEKKKQVLFDKFKFLINQNVIYVTSNVIEKLSDTKSPQGIVAIVNIVLKKTKKPQGNFLVLENLQDPGNLGTIIRSARGTNFKDIYLINCVSPFNQKVVRSTMGSLFFENLYFFKSTQEFIDFKIKYNLSLLATDMIGDNLFEQKKVENTGIVIGNEGNGVSELLKSNCSKFVTIPMKNGLESLNASVATAIMIYYFDNL